MKISVPYILPPTTPELINYWHIDGDCIKRSVKTRSPGDAGITNIFFTEDHPRQNTDIASVRNRYDDCRVSESEAHSVHFYTYEGYHSLNSSLRKNAYTSLHPLYQSHIANIERFIDKVAEPLTAPVFRVTTTTQDVDAFFRQVHPDDILVDPAFISTSRFPDLVKRLRGSPSRSNPLIYYQFDNVSRGADLSAIRADQGEVLIQRKTPFEVKALHKLGAHSLLVCLSEADSQSSCAGNAKDLMTGQPLARRDRA